MKRWVDFDFGMTCRGYENGSAPIDKMADLVLMMGDVKGAVPITSITLGGNDGAPLTYNVVALSETHVGPPGHTTEIYPQDYSNLWRVEMIDADGAPFTLTLHATYASVALDIAQQLRPDATPKKYTIPTLVPSMTPSARTR